MTKYFNARAAEDDYLGDQELEKAKEVFVMDDHSFLKSLTHNGQQTVMRELSVKQTGQTTKDKRREAIEKALAGDKCEFNSIFHYFF